MASSIIATSVDRQSQWWSDLDTWKSHANPIAAPNITPYWDFLLAATNSKSDFQNLSLLGLNSDRYRTAGAGATCIVQIGKTSSGKLVAVKIDRAASQPLQRTAPGQYEQNLSQLAKELRLLSHEELRQDPRILDLLGFGIESSGGSLMCFLVTEYCEVRSRFRILFNFSAVIILIISRRLKPLAWCFTLASTLEPSSDRAVAFTNALYPA